MNARPHEKSTKKLGRRALLRGAAGVTLALPFLSVAGEGARADGLEIPKRALTFYTPNGWDPAGRPTSTALAGTVLEGLAPFRDRITTIAGMEQASRRLDPNRNDGAHYHGWSHCVVGDDCHPGSDGRVAGGISWDQQAALALSADTRFRSLNQGGPSWLGPNEPAATGLYSPRAIFDRMFAGLDVDPAGLEEAQLRRRSVLDFASGSLSRLRCRLGREDQLRMEQHLTSIREVERRLEASPVASCTAPAIPPSYEWADHRDRSRELWEEWADLKIELLALAFACDLTRSGTIGLGSPADGTTAIALGPSADHHELSHRSDEEARAQVRRIERWYADKFAQLLARLDGTAADESSSLLDHSVILWVSEGGGRDGHGAADNHYVVAGGAIAGGQHLALTGVPHNDLLLELVNRSYPSDVPPETSFGNPDVCNAGLPDLRA